MEEFDFESADVILAAEESPYATTGSVTPPVSNPLDYSQRHGYEHVTGDVVVPRAYGKPAVINLHQPYSLRRVRWNSQSVGKPPVVPLQGDSQRPSLGQTYLSGRVVCPLPTLDVRNGGFIWTVAGEYTYVVDTPIVLDGTQDIPTGQYPIPVPVNDAFAEAMGGPQFDPQAVFPWPFTIFPKQMVDTTGRAITEVREP